MKKAVGVILGVVLISGCSSDLQHMHNGISPSHDLVQLKKQLPNKDNAIEIIREPVPIIIDSEDKQDNHEKNSTDSFIPPVVEESGKVEKVEEKAEDIEEEVETESEEVLPSNKESINAKEDKNLVNVVEPESHQNCPRNLSLHKIFYDDFYDKRWPPNHIITWFASADFTEQEMLAIEEAIDIWDVSVESIQFMRVDSRATADLYISYGFLDPDINFAAYWQSWWYEYIYKSTITVEKALKDYYSNIVFFKNVMLHELGNVLGLGDIDPENSNSFDSVMLDNIELGKTDITNFDKCLIKKHYNEERYIE